MSFSSKKPLIKQTSIFDSEGKQRSGLSSKKVSFNSTVLTDSDEENSIGKHNRKAMKNQDDDDDLLSMFKNELDNSEDDDIMIGSSSKKGKPSPKPRHNPDIKIHLDNDDTLHSDDLEQTINPKRKPRPPPRTRTRDSQSEDTHTDTHAITKASRQPDTETRAIKPQISLDDSDDDIIISTNKKQGSKKDQGMDLFGESESTKSKKDEKQESSFIESLFGSSKQKKEDSLVKDILQENIDGKIENEKDESKLEKDSTKTSLVDGIFGFSSKQKAKQNLIEEGEEESDKNIRTAKQENLVKNKSMSDDEEASREQKSKPVIKERKMLSEDGKKMKSNTTDTKEGGIRFRERGSKSMIDDSDDEGKQARKDQKTKKLTRDDDIHNYRRRPKERGQKSLLDDSDDDDNDDEMLQRGRKSMKDDDEIRNKHKARVPAPQPRKHLQDPSAESKKKLAHGSDLDSDVEGEREVKCVPVPRTRRDHKQEDDPRSRTQSKLHYLEKDNDYNDEDDSDEDEFRKFQQSRQKALGKNERNGKMKPGKTAGWSSLDESEDDNDETVGKKINLTKARPVSATEANNNKTGSRDFPRTPKSPRPKPRHVIGNTKSDGNHERLIEDSQFDKTDYNGNFNREKNRSKNEREFSPQGRTTPQRPQRRQKGWQREEDVTHMFEDHVPDKSDIVGRRTEPDRIHTRDHGKPHSAVTPKKGPMRAEHRIEEMTKSPQLRQTLSRYDHEDDDWQFTPHRSVGKQRSSSLTNLHQTGRSDYMGYDSEDGERRNSLDTETIRQTVYDNWLNRKNVTIKKELSKKALQKKKEEEMAKEQEEKKRSAKLAFKSWSESKKDTIKEQQAQIKAKKKQEKEKELEKELKKRDAVKYFESWKSKKDEVIKKTHKEKKKEEMEKKKKEEEEKSEKMLSSKKLFENWKARKDEVLKQQHQEKKKKEKLEETKKEDEEYTKTIKNADEFQKWVENKGKPRKTPPPPTLTQRAWVPGSRQTGDCIPGKVQPVILPPSSNRARTMSGTFKTTRKYYDY